MDSGLFGGLGENVFGDMHTHTCLSDGSEKPKQVIKSARLAKLSALSITDHDTFAAYPEAYHYAGRYGVRLIKGAEVSCTDPANGRRVHLLCYLPDREDDIREICDEALETRRKCGEQYIKGVTELYPIDAEDVYRFARESTTIYKQHIMRALMAAGVCSQMYGEVYQILFSGEKPLLGKENKYVAIREALKTAHKAGAVTVLAHPYVYDSVALLEELASTGLLDGVEVWHKSSREEGKQQVLNRIADEYGLLKTGGTDFHGSHSARPLTLGSIGMPKTEIEQLLALKHSRL